ncbi:hypothetical protein H4R24_005694 [Coemansia sp. RSA 988]|nr:hypothetical protein H4R24_005694 [Coemansia sp. RSA 988]
MSRPWSKGRRGVVLAVSAAVLGLLGYLAYEVYQESNKDDDSDNHSVNERESTSDGDSDVEDVLFISEQITSRQSTSDTRAMDNRFLPQQAGSIRPGIRGKPCLAISARGIILDSKDSANKWSADVRIRKSAIPILLRLVELYRVYLIVVVSPAASDDGAQERVLRALGDAGIVNSLQEQVYDDEKTSTLRNIRKYDGIGESVVWVNREDSSDSSNPPSDVPSSQISAILNAPISGPVSTGHTSPAILPRSQVLFCQTEEGKSHMVRHLLTARPPIVTGDSLGRSYAGYIDTNHSVIARLSQVLHTTVLLVNANASDEHNPEMLITYGDVPGAHTAFLPSEEYTDLASRLPNIEIVEDITASSLFRLQR